METYILYEYLRYIGVPDFTKSVTLKNIRYVRGGGGAWVRPDLLYYYKSKSGCAHAHAYRAKFKGEMVNIPHVFGRESN